MTPHQVIAVALRLLAILIGISTLRVLPLLFNGDFSHTPSRGVALLMLALTAVLILAMWFFPLTIARRLLSREVTQSEPAPTQDTWLAMGCALIGLWILTAAVPKLVFGFLSWNVSPGDTDSSQLWHWAIYNFVEIAIATWLVLGGRGFRKVFWWAQNAGTRKAF